MNVTAKKPNTREEVLEIIREIPGCTTAEIRALMPHVSYNAVATMIHTLKTQGIIEVKDTKETIRSDGKVNTVPTYVLSSNPTPNVVKLKRKAPTEAALHMQIRQLQEQIATLEAWKADAIARYPELAVAPVVLRARKLVAEELRAGGDPTLAQHVERGEKDTTLMMRVTIKALEESE